MRLTCRAPLRIDLAGGWSDIPPFAERVGGAVLNVAITQYVQAELTAGREGDVPEGLGNEPGMHIHYGMDLPPGSGLGSSATLSVAWLALIRANMGHDDTPDKLAAMACDLGSLLGILGGKQDEYISAHGGINLMRFTDCVTVERLELPDALVKELERRLVLCYSGRSRLSGDIHDNVWGAFQNGSAEVGARLSLLAETAVAMRDALVAGDLEAVGGLMEQNWRGQKALHATITNTRVEALFEAALAAGARAGKACGAGGGGCLVFFAPTDRVAAVRAALTGAGAQIIPFAFDMEGVHIERSA
jgi:D-glycero-alpha-D-manno-heptose-7-phosphate kinase